MSTLEISQILGNYGEFVGAIAIVITLVYLALQLRQNTASVKSNAFQTWVDVCNAELSAGQNESMAPVIATGLADPASLTNETWVRFANYSHQFVLKAEATYYLQKEKVITAAICEKEFDRAASYLANAGPAQWWAAGARTQFSHEFVAMIERRNTNDFQQFWFTPGQGFHSFPSTTE